MIQSTSNIAAVVYTVYNTRVISMMIILCDVGGAVRSHLRKNRASCALNGILMHTNAVKPPSMAFREQLAT